MAKESLKVSYTEGGDLYNKIGKSCSLPPTNKPIFTLFPLKNLKTST
jgi:hypothetical protein